MWGSLLFGSICVLQVLGSDKVKPESGPPSDKVSDQSFCSADSKLDFCAPSSLRASRSVSYDSDSKYSKYLSAINQNSHGSFRSKRKAENEESDGAAEETLSQRNYQSPPLQRYEASSFNPRVVQEQENLRISQSLPQIPNFGPQYCPHCGQFLPAQTRVSQQPFDPRVFQRFQNPQMLPINQPQAPYVVPQTGQPSVIPETNPRSYYTDETCPYDDGVDESRAGRPTVPPATIRQFINQTMTKVQTGNLNVIPSQMNKQSGNSPGKYSRVAGPNVQELPRVPAISPTTLRSGVAEDNTEDVKMPTYEDLTKFIESKKVNGKK